MRATHIVTENGNAETQQLLNICRKCGGTLVPWTWNGEQYAECKAPACDLGGVTLEVNRLLALTEDEIEMYAATNLRMRFRNAGREARTTTRIRSTW